MRNPPPARTPLSVNNSNSRNPLLKTQLCINFQKGKCYYGSACRFIHSHIEFRNTSRSDLRRNGSFQTKLCYFSFNGLHCPHVNCLFLHKSDDKHGTFYKTRLCEQWMRSGPGGCSYGIKCLYAHGEEELKVPFPGRYNGDLKDGGGSQRRKVDVVGGKGEWLNQWDVEKIGRIYGDWLGSNADDVEDDREIGI